MLYQNVVSPVKTPIVSAGYIEFRVEWGPQRPTQKYTDVVSLVNDSGIMNNARYPPITQSAKQTS